MIAAIAIFLSLGGSVYAAAKIDGKKIRKESIPGNRVQEQSLTGALINESSLAPVPSATTATEAARAEMATRAVRAELADFVERANSATTAGSAEDVAEAGHVDRTDFASQAPEANTLSGNVEPQDLVIRCQPGSVRGAAFIDPRPATPTAAGFNCLNRADIVVRRVKGGEYQVTFGGIENAPATASALGRGGSSASIAGRGPTYTVKIYSASSGDLLPIEPFLVAVF
ncbi:MAG TPA: hypothetical protein VFX45_10625 [Solirubrobacterales bacterium]|nr:hypothetical protein [Solirubrobacterales bacterium]